MELITNAADGKFFINYLKNKTNNSLKNYQIVQVPNGRGSGGLIQYPKSFVDRSFKHEDRVKLF